MKKVLAGLAVLTFICIASSAMAAGVKVPKTLCLDWASYDFNTQLTFKSTGTIYDQGAKVTAYAINGRDDYGLLSGTGYVDPGTTTLIATFSGMYDRNTVSNYELVFNLETGSGTVYFRYDNPPNNTLYIGTDGVTIADCTTLGSITAAPATDGPALQQKP